MCLFICYVAVICGNLVKIGRASLIFFLPFMGSNLDLSLLLYSLVGDAVGKAFVLDIKKVVEQIYRQNRI
uniref:Putative ovule protein n=1 Tax=Solanum chacoense TaxID=4108 RepID=A0A0V0HB67_SOLCH